MGHYTKEELELYRHNEMSVLGRIACASHLKSCPECEKLLRELEDEDRFVDDLRNSVKLYKDLSKGEPAPSRRTANRG
jgi:hypothetical protein